jgi:hypothetical protein
MNSDFKDLLKLFNDSEVRYLVVDGHAVMKYTEPRYTKELDIWIDASPRNGSAVYRCLRKFGAPLAGLNEADFAMEGVFYQMGRPPARVDISMSIAGVRFADAWRNRVATDVDGVEVHVISREDLIVNKRALGRPQDLADLANLEHSKNLASNRGGQSKRAEGGANRRRHKRPKAE